MTLNVGRKGNLDRVEQPLIEAGSYPGRIVQIIDMGLQAQRPFKGEEKKPAYEVNITYELADVFLIDKDGNELEDKPRWVSETIPVYSIDNEKAKSTQRYNAADPKCVYNGDFSKLIDTPVNIALITNVSKGVTYTNVASIASMRPKDAEKCPALKNPSKVFDLDDPNLEVFHTFSAWIQDKLKSNLKYSGSKLERLLNPDKKEEKQLEDNSGEDVPW